jgi:N-acetylmuramoyl-L-alanine amidase
MRARPLIIAAAIAATLAAGCSSTGATPTPNPTGSRQPATAGDGQGSTPRSSDVTTSTRQPASTVVAPSPTSSPPPTTASGKPTARPPATGPTTKPATGGAPSTTKRSRPVVTKTVTVTPTQRTTSTPPSTSKRPATSAPPTTSTRQSAGGTGSPTGTVVVIDPGHNGANAQHPEIITQQVPAGFGEYKDCNTTGTETNAGYPEYRFNWQVALALRDALQAKGITVVMTRDSDDGVGPCVDKRAAIGNDAHADAVVSIHGDGESADIKGFYVMTASRAPAGQAMAERSLSLAASIRDGLSGAGFPVSNALGSNGLWTRSDLAGLNLSLRPTVMIECGNMRNATEAELMSSAAGQQRYAQGIASGVLAFLGG